MLGPGEAGWERNRWVGHGSVHMVGPKGKLLQEPCSSCNFETRLSVAFFFF